MSVKRTDWFFTFFTEEITCPLKGRLELLLSLHIKEERYERSPIVFFFFVCVVPCITHCKSCRCCCPPAHTDSGHCDTQRTCHYTRRQADTPDREARADDTWRLRGRSLVRRRRDPGGRRCLGRSRRLRAAGMACCTYPAALQQQQPENYLGAYRGLLLTIIMY